ncbi:transglutaminase domain-containing protein [Enterovibrio norvegicus]|uniref:Transglutaminase-like superfamily protein n=2 Tax=Enterovibrio norvegicus TaxID=188144 RepID=A0A1I5PU15_9GAMM|nr:transglutaminase domain-containing protein [Enterovibrio norvegicus]MCC4798358.1 transglutaminase domain-containing protein [Enterovibrio norvegicus]OEE49632.1 hypothetical protein A1OS_00555 [Enterovibrio norvegicus]OEF55679.1 hypothetical protein A1OW_05725 [Enterovibrio norvegicus]OEF56362.1 hypothetical protein A1OU_16485 [Enterovibrio norvegicus]PMH65288.1 hypothetical protein BCU62_13290 [Enterovibrio norvegicus]
MGMVKVLPLVAGLIILSGFLQEKKDAISDETKQLMAKSQNTLTEKEVAFSGGRGELKVIPNNRYITQYQIQKWKNELKGKYAIYSFSERGIGEFTSLAPDINGDFHLTHSYLEGYLPFKVDNPLIPMLTIARKKKYQYDHEQYKGNMEVWQSSKQSYFYPSGDCEDHAILLADWLIELGYDARVVIGDYDGGGHAWVVMFYKGKEYVLEATQKSGFGRQYPLASTLPKYHPTAMFNREHYWVNQGSALTTNYASSSWRLMSQFTPISP